MEEFGNDDQVTQQIVPLPGYVDLPFTYVDLYMAYNELFGWIALTELICKHKWLVTQAGHIQQQDITDGYAVCIVHLLVPISSPV